MCLISRRFGSWLCFRYPIEIYVLKRIVLGTLVTVNLSRQALALSNEPKKTTSFMQRRFVVTHTVLQNETPILLDIWAIKNKTVCQNLLSTKELIFPFIFVKT